MINIDFSSYKGIVVFDDFYINPNIPLSKQLYELKEDMLQVEFPGNYILDIGWRPSFNIDGYFHVLLIKDFDWEEPKYTKYSRDINQLIHDIQLALTELDLSINGGTF